jgi:predicted HTH transcriptional regulator
VHSCRQQQEPTEATQAQLNTAPERSRNLRHSCRRGCQELLDHYQLARGGYLTHLGILCLGRQHQRAQLTTAPSIQFIKYDDHGQKVNKLVWDDYTLNPMELIEAVWVEVPDFRERYELPDGLYRQNVPAFDEVVVRELLVNALVHRPYTQRGDIFLNLHPDRSTQVRYRWASRRRTCCTPPCVATSTWPDSSMI